jgi:hypothetical protein
MTVKIEIHGASTGGHFFKKYETEVGDATPQEEGECMVSTLRNYLKGLIRDGELTSGKIVMEYTRLNCHHNGKNHETEEYHGLDTDNV